MIYVTINHRENDPAGYYYRYVDADDLDEGIIIVQDRVYPAYAEVQGAVKTRFGTYTKVSGMLEEVEGELLTTRTRTRESIARTYGWKANTTGYLCAVCQQGVIHRTEPVSYGGAWGQVYHFFAQCVQCGVQYTQIDMPDYTRLNTNDPLESTWSYRHQYEQDKHEETYRYTPKPHPLATTWEQALAGTLPAMETIEVWEDNAGIA